MKNLFTLCACAFFAITLSAQGSDQAAGSYYLGTGDATTLINLFHSDVSFTATVGYAVIDDLVVSGSINTGAFDNYSTDTLGIEEDLITLNLGVRYFWNGVFFQAGLDNLLSAGDTDNPDPDVANAEMSVTLGVGKYFSLGAVSDRFYVDPQINYNLTNGFETKIGLGCRF